MPNSIGWKQKRGYLRRQSGYGCVNFNPGPFWEKLRNYLSEIQAELLPKRPEGRAVRYTLKNWNALIRYSDDGDLAIDNATERAIRGVAVGRNNWVFFGSDEGGKTGAVLRSFVASSQRVGVDPFAWLKDILSSIADHPITRLGELLPNNWAPAQAGSRNTPNCIGHCGSTPG